MNLIRSFCAGALLFIPAPLLALKIINKTGEIISITFQQDGDERRAHLIDKGKSLEIAGSPKPVTFTINTLDTHLHRKYTVNIGDTLKVHIEDDELKVRGITSEKKRKERKAAQMDIDSATENS